MGGVIVTLLIGCFEAQWVVLVMLRLFATIFGARCWPNNRKQALPHWPGSGSASRSSQSRTTYSCYQNPCLFCDLLMNFRWESQKPVLFIDKQTTAPSPGSKLAIYLYNSSIFEFSPCVDQFTWTHSGVTADNWPLPLHSKPNQPRCREGSERGAWLKVGVGVSSAAVQCCHILLICAHI